jgi:hypothetical protein
MSEEPSAGRALEAGHQCRGFTETARQADHGELLAIVQHLLQGAAGIGAIAIDDEDEFERQADGADAGLVLGVQRAQLRTASADGHDYRDRWQRR